MIGGNRLSHSYPKIGRTLVRVVCLRMTWQFIHVPVTDDEDSPATMASGFYHWIGYLVVDEGSKWFGLLLDRLRYSQTSSSPLGPSWHIHEALRLIDVSL